MDSVDNRPNTTNGVAYFSTPILDYFSAPIDTLTGRAEQNLMRTLRKLSLAGIVRLDRGEGRAYRPIVAARKVHFEIDLLVS